MVETFLAGHRAEFQQVAVPSFHAVPPQKPVGVILVQVDVQRQDHDLLGLDERQIRGLLPRPAHSVEVEFLLLPLGTHGPVPVEIIERRHVDADARGRHRVVVADAAGGHYGFQPLVLVRLEFLVACDDLLGRELPCSLHVR